MRDHVATVLLYGWVRLRVYMTRRRCGFVGGERRITSNNNNGTHYRCKTIGFEGGRDGDGVPVKSRCLGAVVAVVTVLHKRRTCVIRQYYIPSSSHVYLLIIHQTRLYYADWTIICGQRVCI